ncbi:MAG TPA: hypothetical protein VGO31_10750, partial [Microbacteriaceae bacterium]|nr:hypothetical protein [Microbacteriaceae bacterium]
MRATVVGISFLGVVALVPAGAIFGVNGEQWSWWRAASWAGALSFLVTVSAAAFRRERTESSHPGGKALGPAGILVGLAVIASSLTMM